MNKLEQFKNELENRMIGLEIQNQNLCDFFSRGDVAEIAVKTTKLVAIDIAEQIWSNDMNNKIRGTEFEREVCKKLSDMGYWVHFLTPDERGAQPFDIIAVKGTVAGAIECKTLEASRQVFSIKRLEDNQIWAFQKWVACGNGEPLIFVKRSNTVYIIPWTKLKKQGKVKLQECEVAWNVT